MAYSSAIRRDTGRAWKPLPVVRVDGAQRDAADAEETGLPIGERECGRSERFPDLNVAVALAGGPSTGQPPRRRGRQPTGGGIGLDGGQRARAMEGYSPELGSAGQLKSAWVCWLMGWVPGWTSLGPLSEDAYLAWLWVSRSALIGFALSGMGRYR